MSSPPTKPPAEPVPPATPPAGAADMHDPATAHLPELKASDLRSPPPVRRRTVLPVVLFLATCASTFWVGATAWDPLSPLAVGSARAIARVVYHNWQLGLTYMAAVLAILLTHEMGHFLQTLRHHIPASYPLCIPVPFNAVGTMGAVIGMEGMKADRRQIFDIGIAGPLAGLVVAVPVFWYGISRLDLSTPPAPGEFQLYLPVLGQWMMKLAHGGTHPEWADTVWVARSQLGPYFMAGWVGMLITGLNMLPISQLDGGHTIYALFLRDARTLAQWFISLAILYIVINLNEAVLWAPMLVLVILMGIHHPPTANDNMPLGRVRWTIGVASLVIPYLCFPLLGFRQ